MRFAGSDSWQIGVRADSDLPIFALWLRDVERIEVPPSPLVPGPLDVGELPPPAAEPHDARLGAEWLAWWASIVDRTPRPPVWPPDTEVEPAADTPDPLGLARLAVVRAYVTRRWTPFLHWRFARRAVEGTFADRRPHADRRNQDVVRSVEAALGRRAAPFKLRFTLLPVRDDRILRVEPAHFLVPERVYQGPGWAAWLRAVVEEVA